VAAKRELLEETGLVSNDWTSLGTLYQAVGIGNIPFEIFIARNVTRKSDERDKDEQITNQQFMSVEAIETLVRTGAFQNSPVLAALYLAKLHGL
jgi:ADP-ribose pyrophosphatase